MMTGITDSILYLQGGLLPTILDKYHEKWFFIVRYVDCEMMGSS